MQVFDKREYPFLHHAVHLRSREIVKHAPLQLGAVHRLVPDLHFLRKDAFERQAQHGAFLRPQGIGSIQIMDEHEIGHLLNHIQRIGQATRPEDFPDTVNSVFQFAGNHNQSPLFQI